MSLRTLYSPIVLCFVLVLTTTGLRGQSLSPETENCLICHRQVTPGIVADWESSRHSQITPAQGMQKSTLEQRISAGSVPDSLMNVVVGCGECHRLLPDTHTDTFNHNGINVHTVVTPNDCAVCHPQEQGQYLQNKMAHARTNLTNNATYQDLLQTVNGLQAFENNEITLYHAREQISDMSCFYCHGTQVTVDGITTRQTSFGAMEFPNLTGWPNQGVGRINPDSSKGSCTSCHARHSFSIEMARKPYTCGECHKGPDVLAYKVYEASKMGNIYSSHKDDFDFTAVPWTVGQDFTAPTCATCHVSLVVDENGNELAFRSHQMNNRLYVRLFGLPYAHPQPRSPQTPAIRNQTGLQLPTNLDGTPVQGPLIDQETQNTRKANMQAVCEGCHSTQWVEGHFEDLDAVIRMTNNRTLEATKILAEVWSRGLESGLPQQSNIFDETIEKQWFITWFFHANSIRLGAAMAGVDYAVFDNGRLPLSIKIQEMHDWMELKTVTDSLRNVERMIP